jgi:hypothetical protein
MNPQAALISLDQALRILDPGFLCPLPGQPSTLNQKKPESRDETFTRSGLSGARQNVRRSAKDPDD